MRIAITIRKMLRLGAINRNLHTDAIFLGNICQFVVFLLLRVQAVGKTCMLSAYLKFTLYMAVSFIYFDLDDTLTDHKEAARNTLIDLYTERIKALMPSLGVDDFIHTYEKVNRAKWVAYAAKEIDKQEVKYGRFRDTMTQLGGRDWPVEALSDDFLSISQRYWHWVEGAEAVFKQLLKSYSCGIITNGFAEIQEVKFAHFGIDELADPLLVSEEIGAMKPDPAVFEYAASLVGHSADELLYVGDSLHSDVAGATAAGWTVVWYNPSGAALPADLPSDRVHSIRHFDELPKLVEKL